MTQLINWLVVWFFNTDNIEKAFIVKFIYSINLMLRVILSRKDTIPYPGPTRNFCGTVSYTNFSFLFNYFIVMSLLPACLYVHCMCAWCPWSLEEVHGSPGTGSMMVMNHRVVTGKHTWLYCKSSKHSNSWVNSPAFFNGNLKACLLCSSAQTPIEIGFEFVRKRFCFFFLWCQYWGLNLGTHLC